MASQAEHRTPEATATNFSTLLGFFYENIISTIRVSLGIDKLINELNSVKKTMASLKYTLEETTARRGLYLSQLNSQPYRSQPFQLYSGQRFAFRRHASEPDLKTATARNFTPIEPFNITVIAHKANGPDYYSARAQYDTLSDFNLVSERLVKRLRMMQHRQAVSGDRWCLGFESEPVQLTHRIKLSWHVSSDMRTRDDVFFVAPNARFDVLFGRNFIISHGDLASAVPQVLAITRHESRAQARQREAEEEQVRLAEIEESRRREQDILSEHYDDQDHGQEHEPVGLQPSNEAISQAGTWTSSSNTLNVHPTVIDNNLILVTPPDSAHSHATSLPISFNTLGDTGLAPEANSPIAAIQDIGGIGHRPSLLGYRENNFPTPSQGVQGPPTQDEGTAMSSTVLSNNPQSKYTRSQISQHNTEITAPSIGPSDHSVVGYEQTQDTANHSDTHGSSVPLVPQTITVPSVGDTDRQRQPSRLSRIKKRFRFSSGTVGLTLQSADP